MEQSQQSLSDQLLHANQVKQLNPQAFEDTLKRIIAHPLNDEENNELNLKTKEQAFQFLSEFYCLQGHVSKVQQLVVESFEYLNVFTKTRAAKIVRQMIDQTATVVGSEDVQIQMCQTLIDWCTKEKKTYLRHKIEIRLAALYQQTEKYTKGLEIIEGFVKEVRKADDKHMLLEIYITESKLHFGLENHAKSKASLTAARACANSIYCPPKLQADIDNMGGILLAADQDYKTAYSYFYEAFEAYNSLEDSVKAVKAFKYMLLTKIMSNNSDDVNQLLASKNGLKYAGRDLDAMKSINQNYQNKSLIGFNQTLLDYAFEIRGDPIIKLHIESLYDTLMEKNLFSVIHPYSRVQISYVAERMQLDEQTVQRNKRLSELILDKKVEGTLDQGNGCLILFDSLKNDNLYSNSLEVIKNMGVVVDKLFDRIKVAKI